MLLELERESETLELRVAVEAGWLVIVASDLARSTLEAAPLTAAEERRLIERVLCAHDE